MMLLIDANLLIYAVNSDSPHHVAARRWLERTLSGNVSVGLAWIVLLAFLRVTTRSGIMQKPLASERALFYIDSWLRQPLVELIHPGEHHWSILKGLLESTGTAGNLTSDAHLAALALERGSPLYSTDRDFGRFPGIKHVNPLADVGQ